MEIIETCILKKIYRCKYTNISTIAKLFISFSSQSRILLNSFKREFISNYAMRMGKILAVWALYVTLRSGIIYQIFQNLYTTL